MPSFKRFRAAVQMVKEDYGSTPTTSVTATTASPVTSEGLSPTSSRRSSVPKIPGKPSSRGTATGPRSKSVRLNKHGKPKPGTSRPTPLIDASLFGETFVITSPSPDLYNERGQIRTLVCAHRWVGNDFQVTIPMSVPRWHDWPPENDPRFWQMKKHWKKAVYNASVEALRRADPSNTLDWDPKCGRFWALHRSLSAIGFVRTVITQEPDEDSLFHTMHYIRDAAFDVWCGFKVSPRGTQTWLGCKHDQREKKLWVHCQYNQFKEDGAAGIRIVFRFKERIAA